MPLNVSDIGTSKSLVVETPLLLLVTTGMFDQPVGPLTTARTFVAPIGQPLVVPDDFVVMPIGVTS